ncbi:hypothetical protein L873DRAFT_1799013 [Choiromyces venosus 120613-1]|uniref:Uncharacterized protein n=1 Tax=Choiromyces venosus 120613-1 TaxID=1336337 RepID=A0A3N4KFI1_9PEZI|nr:hypothetical protein L873DRAFT_1799013 [Choiromyces venosus 120613-1]
MAANGITLNLAIVVDIVGAVPTTVMYHCQGRKEKNEEACQRKKLTLEEEPEWSII